MNISETVQLALIVAVPAMLSPVVLNMLNSRAARLSKDHDWARQDAVAKAALVALTEQTKSAALAASEAARLLAEKQSEIAAEAKTVTEAAAAARIEVADATRKTGELLATAIEQQATASKKTVDAVEVVHTLVNSRLTEQMTLAMKKTERALELLRKQAATQIPSDADLDEIAATEAELIGMVAALKDRAVQQAKADEQIRASATAAPPVVPTPA